MKKRKDQLTRLERANRIIEALLTDDAQLKALASSHSGISPAKLHIPLRIDNRCGLSVHDIVELYLGQSNPLLYRHREIEDAEECEFQNREDLLSKPHASLSEIHSLANSPASGGSRLNLVPVELRPRHSPENDGNSISDVTKASGHDGHDSDEVSDSMDELLPRILGSGPVELRKQEDVKEVCQNLPTHLFYDHSQLSDFPDYLIPYLITNLRMLSLTHNDIPVVVPGISKLHNLQILNLSYNSITKIPDEIGLLESLIELNVSHNNIPVISQKIGDLKKLLKLDLSHNNLHILPTDLRGCESLRWLDLRNNVLPTVPSCVADLPELRIFNAHRNQIRSITPDIEHMKKIHTLILSKNKLSDSVPLPSAFKDLSTLRRLYMRGNHFKFMPPEFLIFFQKLEVCSLDVWLQKWISSDETATQQ